MGKGQDLYRRAKQLIPGGTQLLSKRPEMFLPDQWPAYFSRAQGCDVWDLDGRHLVDVSNMAVGSCPLGYADPDVNAAVQAAVAAGSMCTLNCPEEVELAELLCELHPWAQMVRYARTGGEIMMIAVRIARAKTGRSKVAFCGYHGWHDWYLAANLTEADALGRKELLLPGLDPCGVPRELRGTSFGFRFNHAAELKEIVARAGDDLAAVVTEPQRGPRPQPGFLEEVKEIAARAGAVLIIDEISSGFRMNTGGIHLLYGVTPDLAVFAKAIGNGHPMAAVIGTAAVMEAAQSTFISSTYWTERVGPAAALATIRKYRRLDGGRLMVAAGRRMQAIWAAAAQQAGVKVHVGPADMPPFSHFGFECEQPRAAQTLWCQAMLDRGYLDNAGFYATCAHTDAVLDRYAAAAGDAMAWVGRHIREGTVAQALRGPVGHSGFARLTG